MTALIVALFLRLMGQQMEVVRVESMMVGRLFCAAAASYGGRSVPDILVTLMARDKATEMQLAAAKWLVFSPPPPPSARREGRSRVFFSPRSMTFLSRAGALHSEDPRIVFKALPTLVRMCKKERTPEERAHGAETLAYLAEVDTELQRIASISDHLIPTLAELLKYQPPSAVVLYKGPVPAVTMKKVRLCLPGGEHGGGIQEHNSEG